MAGDVVEQRAQRGANPFLTAEGFALSRVGAAKSAAGQRFVGGGEALLDVREVLVESRGGDAGEPGQTANGDPLVAGLAGSSTIAPCKRIR
jgi:hypothetical protein